MKLGRGGMADVYLAVSRAAAGLERLVVIKRVRPDLVAGDDPEDLAHFTGMFWDEAKLAMLLNHVNVVHTHDACEEDGSLYLVMEYIEGQPLNSLQREMAKRGRHMTAVESAIIMGEVLNGLHYAHELTNLSGERLNIVHRDVSPQNVLIGYDGAIKLVDFGVAKAATRSTETRAGTLKGKARYMAPEQILNRDVDRRADIYSAGVVLWESVARKKMVAGANMLEQLATVLKTEPPRLSSVVPDVDKDLETIIHTALAREPKDRYQNALDMREALRAWVTRVAPNARIADIGALVLDTFKDERDKLAKQVRESIAAAEATERASMSIPVSSAFVRLDEDHRMGGPSLSSSSGNSAPRSAPSVTPAGVSTPAMEEELHSKVLLAGAQRSRTMVMALVACLLVLLGIVGALAGVVLSGSKSHEPIAAAAAPPPPPPATIVNPTPAAQPADPAAAPKAGDLQGAGVDARTNAVATNVAPARPQQAAAPQPRWTPPPSHAPAAPATAAAAPAAPAPPTEQSETTGFLTLDTYPWTKVTMDGKVLGNTPLVKIVVPAGSHTLVMENPGENVKQTTTIYVKPNETVSKRLAF